MASDLKTTRLHPGPSSDSKLMRQRRAELIFRLRSCKSVQVSQPAAAAIQELATKPWSEKEYINGGTKTTDTA